MPDLFEAYPAGVSTETALIPVKNDEAGQLVDAKELYNFLNVGARFNDWFERRVSKYSFLRGVDFYSLLSKNPKGRPSTTYMISLDMAKQLCMVENNERGMQARKYFIECERRAQAQLQDKMPQSYPEALRALAESVEEKLALQESIEEQQVLIEEQEPKAEAFDRMMDAGGFTLISKAAKIIGIGPNEFFKYLRKKKVLLSKGSMWNAPSQKAIRLGWAVVKIRTYQKRDGSAGTSSTTYLTVKGIDGSRKLLEADGFFDKPMPDLSEVEAK